MTGAHVVVDGSTLQPGSLGPATGSVWLDVDSVSFPIHGWNDFVVVVLGWWASAVLRILRGDAGPHEINFMDGPYLVQLSVGPGGGWNLVLVDTGRTRRVRSEHLVRPEALVQSIINGSASVLQACREKGCWSPDATTLDESVADLRKEASTIIN